MNKTLTLIKTMLKMQYSKAGKTSSQLWLFVILFLFLIPILALYIGFIKNVIGTLYDALQPMGQESLILGLLFLCIHVFLFFISFFTVLSAFYFAEDIESFIPFPFQPYQVLLGKSASPFLYLYLMTSAIFLPIFYYYGSVSEASLLYYLFGLIVFILLPIIPFSLAAILLMFGMRFVNIAKNKERSKVIAGISTLVFIILINVFVRMNMDSDAIMSNIARLIQEKDGLLQMATSIYPPAYFSTKALTETAGIGGFLFFLALIGISAGVFFLFIWLGQLVYLKGVLGINAGSKRKVTGKKVNKHITNRPVWFSYMLKELRFIFRTPTFLMQCVIQSLFGPVFILIILMMDSNSLTGLMDMFSEKESFLILFLAAIIILGSNATAITSISREGKSWHTNLFLPLDPKQVFFSKIAAAWTINLFTIVLFIAIFGFLLKISFSTILIWLVLVLIASWFTSSLGTYLDFLNPKLNWTDEQEVFKARMISLIGFLVQVGIFGVIVLFLWQAYFIEGLYSSSSLLLVCLIIFILILNKLLKNKINKNDHQRI
ncbi:hypothetical protein QGM71_09495 [Virgibacillus sp. C22-A2]|uniref:ABC transporter permease n=1 Tax=Virgibacillus tibetensis TaxID=3042313 RepID=A0ABU6KEH7_9BACI|nr:hypothetical protein [Virgibacillus sp. C22-A2]